jgi:hypothetical protein
VKEIYAEPGYVPYDGPIRGAKSPMRELVESAGHPYIKLVIQPDDVVKVSAQGVPEQNILPILSNIVKGLARAQQVPE